MNNSSLKKRLLSVAMAAVMVFSLLPATAWAAMAENLPAVMADPAGVLRVFTNLIRNALEHGQTRMDIRLRREGSELLSVFANDASGLTEEDVQHVFDRFFTADKMRTGQSTGLGLAIVKALVERMGHRVTAELHDGMFFITVYWKTGGQVDK